MPDKLRISVLQSNLHWENASANLKMFANKLIPLAGETDLVVLPEMFTTGFSMNARTLAENMEGKTMNWLHMQAESLNAIVTGSLIVEDKGKFYNRLIWMQPDGHYFYYDKRHLFTLAGEHEVYTAGQERLLVEWNGWRICPLICYDLRFPVWCRNIDEYDLLIFVANWPQRRSYHWQQLLIARAIENQSYVVGVNRVGNDGIGHEYTGNTAVIDFSGNVCCQVAGVENVLTVELSWEAQQNYRSTLPFLEDRDAFKLL
jgi:predicted amidohydrolase